jgi:hypothetical protein
LPFFVIRSQLLPWYWIYGVQNEQYFLAFIRKVIEAVLALISKIYWKKNNAFNKNVWYENDFSMIEKCSSWLDLDFCLDFTHDDMDYHVLTFTKDINLDRLILIQFLELSKSKKNTKQK